MKWVLVAACVSACGGGTKPTASVTVDPLPSVSTATTHPVSSPAPTMQAFLDAGCKVAGDALIDCTGASIPNIDKCRTPLHVLSVSFEPPAIVAECFKQDAPAALRYAGCMIRSSVALVAATPHGFVTIDSLEQLAKTFAPVTSPAEAAAFAVASTGSQWFEAGSLGRSESHTTADGWSVRLFNHQICGCSHPTWAIDYAVTREGAVTELARTVVFEDPKMRGLCVD